MAIIVTHHAERMRRKARQRKQSGTYHQGNMLSTSRQPVVLVGVSRDLLRAPGGVSGGGVYDVRHTLRVALYRAWARNIIPLIKGTPVMTHLMALDCHNNIRAF